MKEVEISVVIPCYNEEKVIASNVRKVHAYLQEHFETFEIIVVNDGSSDVTERELSRLAAELDIKIIHHPVNQGKGQSVKDGVLASRHEAILFLDADLGISIEELPKFLVEFHNGFDVVIASRFVAGATFLKPVLWHRKVMERGFRLLRKMVLNNWDVQDTQCGFKLFRRGPARRIFDLMTIRRFAFDSEIIFLANKFGSRIKEVPVALQNPQTSSVRLTYDPINMFLDLLKIRSNNFSRRYEAARFDPKDYREKLIVAADDFGISDLANQNILRLVEQGKIDRVAVLVHNPIPQADVERLLQSRVKLDIHLDRKDAISADRKLKEGVLKRGVSFVLNDMRGSKNIQEMRTRWSKQIEKFVEIFHKVPDGANAHEHIHFFPPYLKAILDLCREYQIPYVRFGKKTLIPAQNNVFRILQVLRKKGHNTFLSSSCESSDYLVSLDWIREMNHFLRNLPEGRTEVVCHPELTEDFEKIARFF